MATMLEIPPAPATKPTMNPRKRKKRTQVAGASADCFKCAERSVDCDRRRPYCSQCLDAGEDCSGYKTQLTWGVGVASRGKLRGLSLPIAGTQKTETAGLPPPAKRRKDSSFEDTAIRPSRTKVEHDQSVKLTNIATASTLAPVETDLTVISNHNVTVPDQGAIWDPTFFSAPHDSAQYPGNKHSSERPFYQKPGATYATASYQLHNVFQNDSWVGQQAVTTSYLAPNSIATPGAGQSSDPEKPYFDQSDSYTTSPGIISPAQLTFPDTPQVPAYAPIERLYDGISLLLEAGQSMRVPNVEVSEQADDEVPRQKYDEIAVTDEYALISASAPFDFSFPPPTLPGVSNIGKTARMQYLINYYAEVISPVIVAFDSPSNPFRTQILKLAGSSETLQHAIAALSASNLRQRRGIGLLSTGKTAPARRSSFAHVHLSNEYGQQLLSAEEQMREEILHKRMAVSQLNQQLSHPVLRKGDSILATLLVLCLFHICDSGIAKFQTQFSGVRKLLALRGDDIKIGSEDSRWMSRLFTWYDALAATVNDRERRISGQFLDMSALGGDWALENLAGVDGQLFKSISKLGRLNLLQQGKVVGDIDAFTPMPMPFGPDTTYASLDGNGWVKHDSAEGLGIDAPQLDNNKRFWQEWYTIRQELLSWNLDTSLFDTLSSESCYLTVEQRNDLENISQSFRYSALLYLERLAQPTLPSADEAIQQWVRQSLRYIKEVVSDVYLLWPLFITGTECIDDAGRNVIRGRCADIQKDSGFVNNASCLQLLEKIWRTDCPELSPKSDEGSLTGLLGCNQLNSSAFRFRDVMMKEAAHCDGEGDHGEYIVV